MENRRVLFVLLAAGCLVLAATALPASVVEQVKADDLSNKKVKRAQQPSLSAAEDGGNKETTAYLNPTAIKRGINLKTEGLPLLTEWDQQRYRIPASEYASPLYGNEGDFDDKPISEYEKGYRYSTNRDKLDEALENAILKSEVYGDPAAMNQYRYYGNEEYKRRRRNAHRVQMSNRLKREVELSPEDILTILTLWENERQQQQQQQQQQQSHPNWPRYEPSFDLDTDKEDTEQELNDEDWLSGPVYPHMAERPQLPANYYYETGKPQQGYEKRGRWGGFSETKKNKRFMVSKKRSDPTREIRVMNGPTRNDFYTLSELLGSQPEPDLPVYQRYVL